MASHACTTSLGSASPLDEFRNWLIRAGCVNGPGVEDSGGAGELAPQSVSQCVTHNR